MQPEVQHIYSDFGVLVCLYMSVSLIFQQGSPTSLGCFSSARTISIPSWQTNVISVIMCYTLSTVRVFCLTLMCYYLLREKQTKISTLRPAQKLGKPTNSNKIWHRTKFLLFNFLDNLPMLST